MWCDRLATGLTLRLTDFLEVCTERKRVSCALELERLDPFGRWKGDGFHQSFW